jgi:ribosome-associated translation inhibitor RaiA
MGARALGHRNESDFDLDVVRSGSGIGDGIVEYARRKVHAAVRAAPAPVLFGRIKISHEPHRTIERPTVVAVSLDVDGHVVRAHAAGRTAMEAVDLVEERLRRQLLDAHQRIAFLRRRHTGVAAPGEWRHGDEPTARPGFAPRPPEERQVIRTKTFSLDRCTAEAAVVRMEMLDHDFHLFVDSATDGDAMVSRLPDGGYEVSRAMGDGVEPHDIVELRPGPRPPTLTLESGLERSNDTDAPFLFFVDAETMRGTVLYRRPDGHYGVVRGELPRSSTVGREHR